MPTSIEEADAELNDLLDCLSLDDRKLARAGARRIYGALIDQERQQAEVYRAEMVKAQDAFLYQATRARQLYEETQRLRALLEDSCPTVNVNSEAKA